MTHLPHLTALFLALWLAGCATNPHGDNAASAAASASGTSASEGSPSRSSLPSYIPSGPLKPITAAEASSQSVAMLEPPPDLWSRIRQGYAMPNLDSDLVRQQEQWYTSRPEYIQRMADRSRKYLFHVVEELERRGMPAELALLPFIESAFNPLAVSSARAAGMWQFMPATGRDFDLKQNVFRDDRRDVLASTRAALDYLQKLYGMFGDWHLALAAYNWGEGSVSRAIARNQKAGLGTSYTDLNMPNETRNYVPKLQAVKNIVGKPERFSAELPLIENHPYFDSITITRDIDVELAAKLADVRLEDFKALNPSLNHPVIFAAGTPQILLPWDNAKVFQRNFDAYNAGQYASWTAWTAPSNMSASEAARRVGMSEAEFRTVNKIPPRMLIRAGSVVLAPRDGKMQADVASHVADNAQLNLAPEVVLRRTTVRAGKRESVATIASRYRITASQVAEWNKVDTSAAFKAGQQVVLYLPTQPRATRQSAQGRHRATGRRLARGPVRAVKAAAPVARKQSGKAR